MRNLATFSIYSTDIVIEDQAYALPQNLNQAADKFWEDAQLQARNNNRQLWNGTVYRLSDIHKDKDKISLILSQAQYKHYLIAPHVRKEMKKMNFKDRINGLYVAAHIVTSDGKYVLGKTAKNSPFPHKYDLISGSLNQDEMVIGTALDLVTYIKNEIKEESGLNDSDIKDVKGICILETSSTRIGVFFLVSLEITAEQATKQMITNFEHQRLLLLDRDQLKQLAKDTKTMNPTVMRTLSFIK